MNKLQWLAKLKVGDDVVLTLDNDDKYLCKLQSVSENGHMKITGTWNVFVGGESRIGIDEKYKPAYFIIDEPTEDRLKNVIRRYEI